MTTARWPSVTKRSRGDILSTQECCSWLLPHLLLFPLSCFLTDLHCFYRWFRESRGLLWQRSVWKSRPIVKIWEVSRNRRSRLSVGRSPVCLCTSLFIVQMYIVYHTPSRLNNIYVSPSVSPFIAVHYTMKFSVPLWTSTIGLCTTLPSVVYEQFWRTPVSVPGVPPSLLQTVAEIWEIIPTLKPPKCFSVPNLNLSNITGFLLNHTTNPRLFDMYYKATNTIIMCSAVRCRKDRWHLWVKTEWGRHLWARPSPFLLILFVQLYVHCSAMQKKETPLSEIFFHSVIPSITQGRDVGAATYLFFFFFFALFF